MLLAQIVQSEESQPDNYKSLEQVRLLFGTAKHMGKVVALRLAIKLVLGLKFGHS